MIRTDCMCSVKQWRIQDGIPPGCKSRTGFWRPGQIEEWRPSAEVLDGGRGLDARSDHFFFSSGWAIQG